jgi:AcrR family transcriptional regulator
MGQASTKVSCYLCDRKGNMSHAEQIDLRVRRTHKFLQDALIELIAEKGFTAVTVGDIAERAMINRATFYRHYQDKYDLLAKIFEETSARLVAQMKPIRKDAQGRVTENPPEIWIQLFEHVEENARLYRAMLGKNGSSWFAARIRERTVEIMLEQESQWKRQMTPTRHVDPAMPPDLPAMQLAHVLIGAITWWLESEQRSTPRQMASWFYQFAFFGYLSALGYEVLPPGNS